MLFSSRFRKLIAWTMVIPLSGCASFWHPYVQSDKLSNDIKSATPSTVVFYGKIDSAFEAADDQRQLYLNAVNNHAMGRTLATSALYAISAWTVYKGVTTDSVSARRNIALGSAVGGATYAFSNWFTNRPAEAAYLSGYRGITCAMWQTRPFLIETAHFAALKTNESALTQGLSVLNTRLQELELFEAEYRDIGGIALQEFRRELRFARSVRNSGYRTLDQANIYKTRVENAGFTLRRRVELIMASINEEVQRSEPRLERIDSIVAQFTSQTNRVVGSLRPDPLNLRDDNEFEAKTADAESGAADAPAPAASSTAQTRDQISASQKTLSALRDRISKLEKTPSSADLKKQLEDLKKAVDLLAGRATTAGATVTTQAENAIATGLRDKIKKLSNDRKELRVAVEKVRDEMRPINNVLRAATARSVSRNSEQCRPMSASILEITPDDEDLKPLKAEATQTFTIMGGEGVPRVFLVGNTGKGDSEVKLATRADNGIVSATVTTGKKLPDGALYIVFTDGPGKQREEYTLKFEAAAPAPSKDDPKK